MMNPDMLHMMHQQRHQKLWAEMERDRLKRQCAGAPTVCARLATWLRRISTRRMRGVKLIGRSA